MRTDPEARRQLAVALRLGAVGVELATAVTLGYLGGRWLDGAFGTSHWLSLLGVASGALVGFRALYLRARTTDFASL